MSKKDKVLCVVSGGLDSVTMTYDMMFKGWDVSVISFDYGQKHNHQELACASHHAIQNGWQYDSINLRDIGGRLRSALIIDGEIPEGHYAAENMKATIVPNRNAIMLSVACGIAVSRGVRYIATAVHGGDHPIYPDCRPEFISGLSLALQLGNEDFMGILAPYIQKDKNYIAQRAVDIGYDYKKTWSCYKGGIKHCGRCGTCVERMEAIWSTSLFEGKFRDERVDLLFDATLYEDQYYFFEALESEANR